MYDWCKSWSQTLDGRPLGWPQRLTIVKNLETIAVPSAEGAAL